VKKWWDTPYTFGMAPPGFRRDNGSLSNHASLYDAIDRLEPLKALLLWDWYFAEMSYNELRRDYRLPEYKIRATIRAAEKDLRDIMKNQDGLGGRGGVSWSGAFWLHLGEPMCRKHSTYSGEIPVAQDNGTGSRASLVMTRSRREDPKQLQLRSPTFYTGEGVSSEIPSDSEGLWSSEG
jgi:hypothetical protein